MGSTIICASHFVVYWYGCQQVSGLHFKNHFIVDCCWCQHAYL